MDPYSTNILDELLEVNIFLLRVTLNGKDAKKLLS
jgi:hypothetical protein